MTKSSTESVTATELVRDFPRVRKLAQNDVVNITSHGRPEFVIMRSDAYGALTGPTTRDDFTLNSKLSAVLNNIETIVFFLDKKMRLKHYNNAFSEALELPENAIGMDIHNLARTPLDHFFLMRTNEVLNSGQQEVISMSPSHRPDRMFRFTIKPFFGGVFVMGADITELRKGRDQLMIDTALDHSIARLNGVGTALAKRDGTLLRVGIGFAQMLSTSRSAIVNTRLQTLLDPRSRVELEEMLSHQFHNTRQLKVQYLKGGTKFVSADLVMTPFVTSNERDCIAISIQDISSGSDRASSRQRSAVA